MGGLLARLHVVGTAINRSPLQLGIPGNNIATVIPFDGQGLSATQVTRGNMNFVRKGDYAFMMPQQIGQRGLILRSSSCLPSTALASSAAIAETANEEKSTRVRRVSPPDADRIGRQPDLPYMGYTAGGCSLSGS